MIHFDEKEQKVIGSETPVKGLEPQKTDYKINRYFFLAIIFVFGLLLYLSLAEFFTAFLGAVIFYVLSRKRMDKLVKRGFKKPAAAIIVILISTLIIIIPIGLLGYMLYNKGKFYLAHPDQLVSSLQYMRLRIQHNYGISIISEEKIANIKSYGTVIISKLLNVSLDFVGQITMLYFFLYFLLVNVNRLEAAIVFFLPFKRQKIELFGKELVAQTFSNGIGIPAIAVAQALIGFAGYSIAGINDPGFWAVITGFSSVLPVIGTAIVWLPLTLYLFVINHTWQGIFLATWGAIILGVTDNVVRFGLAKKMADVHPIITVLGVIMGVKYFGITGLIVGPILISYFLILLKIYYVEYQSTVPLIRRPKTSPLMFNLPLLRKSKKKTTLPNADNRSKG